ncbi:MAG: hypothetical protein AMXMBFR84_02130 [Candidatus Hydrogenedentota bacterium]
MKRNVNLAIRAALVCAVAVGCITPAEAFYPFGFFNATTGGELQIIKWPLGTLDRNGNGDVDGPDDGILLNFETGNGTDGFDSTEIAKFLSGLEEWEFISTAYMAFTRGQDIVDIQSPAIDLFNTVTFESADDVDGGSSVTGGSYGVTVVSNTFEDTFFTVGNITFPISSGKIIEADNIVAAVARETENTEFEFLKGLGVIMGGTTIGIGYSPLDNIDPTLTVNAGRNIELRVATLPNFQGLFQNVGVTSSMLNDFCFYDDGNNIYIDSHQDVSPDDIAAVTFMYPRANVDLLFSIEQRARTYAIDGFPSLPIAGGHILAWCDADNNPATARVPWIDTLSGLYFSGDNDSYRGHFSLHGLFKQVTLGTGFVPTQTYTPTYVVSNEEFDPIVFGGDERTVYDTTHGGFNGNPQSYTGHGFDSGFTSEVFNENGNRVGNLAQNLGAGTPLVYDLTRRYVVSTDSNKSLDTILALGRPMFGTESKICPLNVAVAGMVGPRSHETVNLLRAFRDDVLLKTGVGASMVDGYYRMSPAMAAYLVDHPNVLAVVRLGIGVSNWVIAYAEWILAMTAGLMIVSLLRRANRRRLARASAAVAVALGVAGSANAMLLPMDITDYTKVTTDVVQGTVCSVESRWADGGTQIVTDVSIRVDDVVKGRSNKGSQLHIQLPTGRVGAIGRTSPSLPEFKKDEEVLLFLDCQPNGNYMVYAGIAGKYLVTELEGREGKYVTAETFAAQRRLFAEAEKIYPEAKEARLARGERAPMTRPVYVPLDALKEHLREIVNESDEAGTTESAKAPETVASLR